MAPSMSFSSSHSSFSAGGQLGFDTYRPRPSKFLMSLTLPSNISSSSSLRRKKMTQEKVELFSSLEGWAEENVLTFLKPVESIWQPQDFLPDPSAPEEEFLAGIKEIRARAAGLPDEYYVCIVGNMITEEALPTYQTFLNTLDGIRDPVCSCPSPWARWSRQWTAEENRHGDLLHKYLYFSGRLDMRQIEKTIHYLIGSGMDVGANGNPYCGIIYTSFQERATFVAHGNTARHAKQHGDMALARICGLIAADEKRHEMAYTKIVEKLFEVDPDTTMLALADMMRRRITMPGHFMFDGQDDHIYDHYSLVTQRLGVYTTGDYVDIIEFFVKRWKVGKVGSGLSSEGRRAQDYVCGLPERIKKMEERVNDRMTKGKLQSPPSSDHMMVPFSWIFNRSVMV